MEKKLKIQEFIRENPDWERLLAEKPYSLIIQHDEVFGRKLVLLKYNQVESDMSLELVRECRGIILDETTFEPVCVPFFKFFNAGEPNAAEVDWKTAWTSAKKDGCVHSDTPIKTTIGDIPIKEICNKPEKYTLLTFNHKTGMLEEDKAEDISIQCSSDNWFEIELDDGRKIKLTGNHLVWCNDLNCYRRVDELTGNEDMMVI